MLLHQEGGDVGQTAGCGHLFPTVCFHSIHAFLSDSVRSVNFCYSKVNQVFDKYVFLVIKSVQNCNQVFLQSD